MEEHLPDLLERLIAALTDEEEESTKMTALLLHLLHTSRGQTLADSLVRLIDGFLEVAPQIRSVPTEELAYRALRSLAAHHLMPTAEHLLRQELPHAPHVVKAFQTLASHEELTTRLVTHLLAAINVAEQYEQKRVKNNTVRTCTLLPQAATCALQDIMSGHPSPAMLQALYPNIIGTLLVRFGTVVGVGDSKEPSKQVVGGLKALIDATDDHSMQEACDAKESCWEDALSTEKFPQTICLVTGAACQSHPEAMEGLFTFLGGYLPSAYANPRLAATAIVSEMMRHLHRSPEITQDVLNAVLGRATDTESSVKLYALRGLGNMAEGCKDQVSRYSAPVLSSLVRGIDDKSEKIILASMASLKKLLPFFSDDSIAPMLINMCLCIRALFQNDNPKVRKRSFGLLGELARFGEGSAAHNFHDQVQHSLPILLFYANDANEKVSKACRAALQQVAPLLHVESISEHLAQLVDEDNEVDFESFLKQMAILLIGSFPDRLNYYALTSVDIFKCKRREIKMAAIIFVVYLMSNMPKERHRFMSVDDIFTALFNLLARDPVGEVRAKIAGMVYLLDGY
eukprot:gnl/Trimastix_PCT/3596.p1 GENE.gnl/Trimastix_PCT/3596~~gnl/Trimastix_PCT/3596.p1  ORF type:complete len:624 (-),score=209.98 gnl/Trimastix_PCT/3596:183-1895(-)